MLAQAQAEKPLVMPPETDPMRVFVYGTLRKGYGAHSLMPSAHFVQDDTLNDAYLLWLGRIPMLCFGEDEGVKGEVYEIPPNLLKTLDRYEGYPDLYERSIVTLDSGLRAWVYHCPRRKTWN